MLRTPWENAIHSQHPEPKPWKLCLPRTQVSYTHCNQCNLSSIIVLNNLSWKLPSITVLGCCLVLCFHSLLTFSLHSKYCRVKAYSSCFKTAAIRTSSNHIAATVRPVWFCHVSTYRASGVGFPGDAEDSAAPTRPQPCPCLVLSLLIQVCPSTLQP